MINIKKQNEMEKSIMTKLENKQFLTNYFRKIYDLMLSEVYLAAEDFMIEKEKFNRFFTEAIAPTLIKNGGVETLDKNGIMYEGIEYRDYDNINPEWFNGNNFESFIREEYSIPENSNIYEYHPEWINYIPIRQDNALTVNFYEAVEDFCGKPNVKIQEIEEERV